MDNNLETKTKKYITSLLTSTPLVVTLWQLSKDYTNTIGEPIPYQRLGYNSLEHFLRSIPETVNVRGSGGSAEIIPVVSSKSKHVYNLVANQKVTKPKRRSNVNQRRRMNYPPPSPPPLMSIKPFYEYPKPVAATRKIFYPQANSTSTASSSSNYKSDATSEYYNNVSKEAVSRAESTENKLSTNPLKTKTSFPEAAKTETVAETKQQEEKKLDDRRKLEIRLNTIDKTESDESKKCTTNVRNLLKKLTPDKKKFCTEQVENSVPYFVRNNLRALISQCPEGIWCAEVPEKYRKMFRQELNYQELGFRSLIDLCVCLSSIFHYVRPSTEDFKLYDRSRPLPDCAEKIFTCASYNVNNIKYSEPESSGLPNIDWTDINMFLPKGIFKPGKEIPRAFISVEMADYEDDIDIVVGEIYDLSKFWIYVQDTLLDTLMDNIQDFYKENALEYQIPDHLVMEGLYCVQLIFGEYHRALIVDVMPEVEAFIRVIFIDYGTMTKIPLKGACFLHEDFSHLPAQAIRCRLANVFPLEEGVPWTKEASKAFRKMVGNRDLSIKINHINWEDQFLEVYLADVTEENNIFYINDRLVEEGFAQYPNKDLKQPFVDPIYTPIVKYIHLFPTFLELEHGLAPSTGEMGVLHDCDVPINFCYPQYFYIDCAAEVEIIKAAEAFHEKNCMKGKQRAPIRYYDVEQFTQQAPDMSIFGELESEITEFLNRPAELAKAASSDEDFVDADEEDFHARLEVMTEKFRYLTTREEDTVNVLKKDLLMTENIMNDIDFLCKYDGQSFRECEETQNGNVQDNYELFEEDYHIQEQPWELCTIEEAAESVGSLSSLVYYEQCANVPVDNSDYNQMLYADHPLSKLTFKKSDSDEGESGSSNSPQSEYSSVSKNADYDLQQPDVCLRPINFSFLSTSNTSLGRILGNNNENFVSDPECRELNGGRLRCTPRNDTVSQSSDSSSSSNGTPGSKKTDIKAKKLASTNPFLEEDNGTTDTSTDIPLGLKLNRNNPFLTFLSNKDENGSSESSTSTTYDSPIVQANATTQSWTNFDDLSAETIRLLGQTLSTSKSSCDSSSNNTNKCTMATQTIEEHSRTPAPPQCGPLPYFGQQPPIPYCYPNWSSAFANPYYNRYPHYPPSYPYDPSYGAMPSCRHPIGPPGFPPPPGFAPIGSNAVVPSYPSRIQQGPIYYSRPDRPIPLPYYGTTGTLPQQCAAIQFNGPSRTASLSSVSVSVVNDNKDFYDVYNERLKLHVVDDGQ